VICFLLLHTFSANQISAKPYFCFLRWGQTVWSWYPAPETSMHGRMHGSHCFTLSCTCTISHVAGTGTCKRLETKCGATWVRQATRAARKSVALLASMLKFIYEVKPKASGLLLILAAVAGRTIDFLAARVSSVEVQSKAAGCARKQSCKHVI
jgi:hypothetical protein